MALVDAELDFFQRTDRRRSQSGWRRNQNFHHRTYVVATLRATMYCCSLSVRSLLVLLHCTSPHYTSSSLQGHHKLSSPWPLLYVHSLDPPPRRGSASQAFFERLPFDHFPLTLDHPGSRPTLCIRGHSPPLSDGPMRPHLNLPTRQIRLKRPILWTAGQRR